MTNGVAELRPIKCVEMKMAHTAGVELSAQLGRNGRGDELTRSGKVVQSLEQVVEPTGDASAAAVREPAGRGNVGHRQDARHDFDVDTGGGGIVAETEECIRRKEELGDRAISA